MRGDDAIGPTIAACVELWQPAHVEVLVRQQLTPELAEALATRAYAIFVDARVGQNSAVEIRPLLLNPAATNSLDPHLSDPYTLLLLAQALYGYAPRAWLITVCAEQFEYGASLSEQATVGVSEALDTICALLRSLIPE